MAGVVRRKMNSKLYIGNLSYSTTEDELRTLFSQAGAVTSVALIKDRETGRSKGFAFVEMGNQAEA
jgi:RNA recognition motif-containing protein